MSQCVATPMTADPAPESARPLPEQYLENLDATPQALVEAHWNLVNSMARRYAPRFGVARDELISEGLVGLLHAASRFDASKGARFATYARWWIRAYMAAFASKNRRIVTVRGSRIFRRIRRHFRAVERELEQQHGGPVARDQLANALAASSDDIAEVQAVMSSVDVPLTIDGATGPGSNSAANDITPEELVARAEEKSQARQLTAEVMHVLDRRERYVIEDRFLSDNPRSLRELGAALHLSGERVRQLESRALKKMRAQAEHSLTQRSPRA
jgi:RNA polymerase sigma-32 factor